MSVVAEQIIKLNEELPAEVKLVAVSKYHPAEAIEQAYCVGQRIFGESKVQEVVAKAQVLPKDIQWHFIGHLQRNKVKQLLPHVALIHSVDSLRLLETINEESQRIGKVTDILLQLHVAQEESKYGFTIEECLSAAKSGFFDKSTNVRVVGVMGMATFTDDTQQIEREFGVVQYIFDKLKNGVFADNPYFKELSIGMSDDYQIAISKGSTLVRIGSAIFGNRIYK
ncbi:MAG: YggS family pyridoxal phosphate-dependent enzyme [Bacteroidales bacterium]